MSRNAVRFWRVLRVLAQIVWRFVAGFLKDMFSWQTWKTTVLSVWKTAKDIPAAYKATYRKISPDHENPSSPLKKSRGLLTPPGNNIHEALVVRAVMLVMISAAMFGAFYGKIFQFPLWVLVFPLICLPVLLYQMGNYRLGYLGECVVGEELRELAAARGWRVFHSFSFGEGKGDIDHIIVSRKGVFCLETKTWRHSSERRQISLGDGAVKIKKQRDNYDVVRQVKGNAAELHTFLKKELQTNIPFVVPVLVFPGWSVDEKNGEMEVRGRNGTRIGTIYARNSGRICNLLDGMPDDSEKALSPDLMKSVCAVLDRESRQNITDIFYDEDESASR